MKGFTLLEALVTTFIFSFIIIGIYGLMNYARINYDANFVSLALQQQARQGMGWLIKDIRQAELASIQITSDDDENSSITFNTLNMEGIRYLTKKITLSGKDSWQLKRCQTLADPSCLMAETKAVDIRKLIFSPIGNSIKIKLEVRKVFRSLNQKQEQELNFELIEQVKIRNK